VVAKFLSYALDAPARAEHINGRCDGLLDLSGTGLVTALQRRCEEGVGPDGTDAGLVHRWLHREPPR
jgi:hypothetical protein